MQQVRTAQFLFAGANTQRQAQGLDGHVAFNIGADGTPVRASEAVMIALNRSGSSATNGHCRYLWTPARDAAQKASPWLVRH